jgi:hypothetical protein
MLKKAYIGLVVFSFLTIMSACYRMPTSEEYTLIPSTNNPDFTHEKGNTMPGVGY